MCICMYIVPVGHTHFLANLCYSLSPDRLYGGGKTDWYRLFMHAPQIPRFAGIRIFLHSHCATDPYIYLSIILLT